MAPYHSRLDVNQYEETVLMKAVYVVFPQKFVDHHLERIFSETVRGITTATVRSVWREFRNGTITCMDREGGYVGILLNRRKIIFVSTYYNTISYIIY